MKLHRLELTGFGPFRDTQIVDFDAFDGDGVFLISGRTGAGKSSILDGVSFALYGAVPRYEGNERRLRSDHCFLGDPTEVRLEFSIGDRRWRVTRAPEYDRPAKRGGGLTTEPTRALVEERVDGEWIGRAAKPRDVGILLDEEIGLTAQQFQQVILLAQNRFSRFLLAGNDERQAVLRTLFGTRRFERYTEDLESRRREAQKASDAGDAHARTVLDLAERLIHSHELGGTDDAPADFEGRRHAAERAVQRAEYRHGVATTDRATADVVANAATAAVSAAVARAAALAELHDARARLTQLEADSPAIEADRLRLARAVQAETLRSTMDAADRAMIAQTGAGDSAAHAQAAWREVGGGDNLDAAVDRLTGELAVWTAAAERERTLDETERILAAQTADLRVLEEAMGVLDAEVAALPAERARLDADIAAASVVAQRGDVLRARSAELRSLIHATAEATDLEQGARAAEAEYAEANAAASAATDTVTVLLQRRLAGYAGELGSALVDGEPCAVCGATDHPHPALPTDDAVTVEALTSAEEERDRAAALARAAGERARVTRAAHATAAVRAGARPLAELEADARACDLDLQTADRAATELADLTAQRSAVDLRLATLHSDRESRVLDRDRVALERAGALSTATALRAELTAARGDFASVADRVDDALTLRDRARRAIAARDALAERDRALTAALADRDERLAGSDFADAVDARGALLDQAPRDDLDHRVTAHAQALATVRSRLLSLELDTIDTSAVDLDATRRTAADADAARAAAISAEGDARHVAERLRELLIDVDRAAAGNVTLADEAAVVARLADTVAGRAPNTMKMELETFVLAAELEEIVAAANLRLTEMSAGRYTLHHSDARAARGRASGLAIEVLDAYTGRLRSPQSLSGGETFLASLALALGLAEVVTSRAGGVRLDTLFVDEGFGSLDPETLELAMRTLDELRAGGRTVGVISHVEAMKDQLPAQITVAASGQGPSTIRQDLAIAG